MKMLRYIFTPYANIFDAICIGLGFGILIEHGFVPGLIFLFVSINVSVVIEAYFKRRGGQ